MFGVRRAVRTKRAVFQILGHPTTLEGAFLGSCVLNVS
jgi:hypothetical protein